MLWANTTTASYALHRAKRMSRQPRLLLHGGVQTPRRGRVERKSDLVTTRSVDPGGSVEARTIFIVDAHRGDGKRFVVRGDEKLTAFLELESAIRLAASYLDRPARFFQNSSFKKI